MPEIKICSVCGLEFEQFKKRGSQCKPCVLERDNAQRQLRAKAGDDYYHRNKQAVLEKAKERYQKNKEAICRERREQRQAHKKETGYCSEYYLENRPALLEKSRLRHQANPGRKYGLSSEEYWKMVELSRNECAACGQIMSKPCVDHDHTTGKIRGLLCSPCNLAIGLMTDSPTRLEQAAIYLRKASGQA